MEETKMYCYTLRNIINTESSEAIIPWSELYKKMIASDLQENYSNIDLGAECTYLLTSLGYRWSRFANPICLLASEKEIDFTKTKDNRDLYLAPILTKLNTILPKYKEEYKRLKAILDKDSFKTSSKSSNKATVKQNDTPTSYGDYRADNYMSNYSETSNENENSVETNELETYDAVVSRFRNLPQEIINEMKEFEIWI